MAQNDVSSFASIQFSDDAVAEMDQHRRVTVVSRNQISHLQLARVSAAERPIVALLLGIAIIVGSLYPVYRLLGAFSGPGRVTIHVDLLVATSFSLLGVWLIVFALRKRFVLIATTAAGTRKLVFASTATEAEIRQFITEVSSKHGYTVASLPESAASASDPPPNPSLQRTPPG